MRKTVAAVLLVIGALVIPSVPLGAVDGPQTLKSLGGGSVDVRGMYGATSFFVPIPPGASVSGPVAIDIDFSHSALLLPDLSTMTVRVNDVSLASVFLTGANRSHGHLIVPVPNEIIGREGLFVETRFYMRLTRDACEEPTNPALWATVHETSLVTLPTASTGPRSLRDVPRLVMPQAPIRPLTIVVPKQPSPTLLRAAGVVATTLGEWMGAAGRDASISIAHESPGDEPSVEVGVGLDVPGTVVRDARQGVLAIDQAGPVRVVVTGRDPAAVLAAARSLKFVSRFDGPSITLTGTKFAADPARTPPWTKSAASFEQLGIRPLEIAGPGTKVFDVVALRPSGWELTRTGQLDVVIDTAPGVRRGPSFVQATLNGHDLGSQRLVPGGGKHTYSFDVVGSLADRDLRGRPRRALRLQLRVHLTPEQRTCSPLDAEATRATVLETSKLTLPHDRGGRLDLGRFPASVGNPVIAIASSGDDDIANGLQAAASVGRWRRAGQTGDGALVALASELTNSQRRRNLILLGDADDVLGEPIAIEEQPVAKGSRTVVGFAGLVKSTYDAEKTALVIHGDDDAVLGTLRALGSLDSIEAIAGSRVAVLNDAADQTLRADPAAAPPVELAPTLAESRIRDETIIGAVLLATFLVAVILVVRFRWRSPTS